MKAKDDDGITALHLAADKGHLQIAKLLIQKRAKVNVKNDNGETPLMLATKSEFVEVVNLLERHGATE